MLLLRNRPTRIVTLNGNNPRDIYQAIITGHAADEDGAVDIDRDGFLGVGQPLVELLLADFQLAAGDAQINTDTKRATTRFDDANVLVWGDPDSSSGDMALSTVSS